MCVPGAGGRDGDDHVVAREQGSVHGAAAAAVRGGAVSGRGRAARLRRPAEQPRPAAEAARPTGPSASSQRATPCCSPTASRRAACARSAPTPSRSIFPKDRADDVAAAAEWLAGQPFVDKRRLALIGWSHGAMAVLWALRPGFLGDPPLFKTAIAFYPGCRQIDRLEDWRPSVPLTLLIGGCRRLDPAGPLPRARASAPASASSSTSTPTTASTRPTRACACAKGWAPSRTGKAHVGTDQAARVASIKEVMAILREAFRTP